jgi:D-glycero-D-manno-heptose 1,7-bisphosphate phosphatase
MAIKTIFLDRDGVINKEVNYLFKINEFRFIKGVFTSCLYLKKLGYEIIVITNQSGISRGYYSEEDYNHLTQWMLKKFKNNNIDILDIFHCPHHPNSKCYCRKPKPGMINDAKKKYDILIDESWIIGDKEVDIIAGNAAGIKNTVLVRSGHIINEENSNAKYFLNSIQDINNVIKT